MNERVDVNPKYIVTQQVNAHKLRSTNTYPAYAALHGNISN